MPSILTHPDFLTLSGLSVERSFLVAFIILSMRRAIELEVHLDRDKAFDVNVHIRHHTAMQWSLE